MGFKKKYLLALTFIFKIFIFSLHFRSLSETICDRTSEGSVVVKCVNMKNCSIQYNESCEDQARKCQNFTTMVTITLNRKIGESDNCESRKNFHLNLTCVAVFSNTEAKKIIFKFGFDLDKLNFL